MFEIIPGILEKDWKSIEKKIALVQSFSNTIHVDLLDGKFAPNTTLLDPTPFKKYASELFLEVHMMVEEPIAYIKSFADAGFKRFLGHIEKMSDIPAFIAAGQLAGEVGLALDGKTPVEAINVPLDDLDAILIMTINAGFSGLAFMPEHLEKVKTIRAKSAIPIEVDGGVNDQTILQAYNAGVTRFVTTSFLFNGKSPQQQHDLLKNCLNSKRD